jgi:hypothetical protein
MAIAWRDFVIYAASDADIVGAFFVETGHDLAAVLGARGLAAAIDDAAGRTKATIDRFIDWLTERHWGEDPFAAESEGVAA